MFFNDCLRQIQNFHTAVNTLEIKFNSGGLDSDNFKQPKSELNHLQTTLLSQINWPGI